MGARTLGIGNGGPGGPPAYYLTSDSMVTATPLRMCHWVLSIVKRSDDVHGFQVLPRRWVVERTFGWLNRCRRLSKDFEQWPATEEAWIYLAMTRLMLRRLKRVPAQP